MRCGEPPRAANSHSASVGKRTGRFQSPASQSQYATASNQLTLTTGSVASLNSTFSRPVARRKASNSALVTWQRAMRNGETVTRWAGRSSSRPSFWPMRNSPPGISTRSLGLGMLDVQLDYGELQLAFIAVHAVQDDAHLVADGPFAARAFAHHLADVLLISVLVAGQGVDGHQAFDEQVRQFHKEAVLGGGDDQRGEILADAVGHELDLLPLDEFALGVGGAAFGLRALVGQRLEVFFAGGRLAGEDGAQQAVHHQVRIAADGRGEVRIGFGGQGEVADVFRAVARLPQGAQHQVAENPLLGLAFDFGHQPLVVARGDAEGRIRHHDFAALLAAVAMLFGNAEALHGDGADAERDAEVRGKFLELHDALRIGHFVNPVDGGDAGMFQVSGDALVGRQHELLDDAVGDIARRARDAGHGAQFVELDERFRQVEIDGAPAHALLVEHQREFLHQLEALYQRLIALAHGGVAFQQQVDVGVGHALGATDHARGELLAHHLAMMIDLHQRGEHQATQVGDERAEVGGELVGQHGDGAIREVNAGAAQLGFQIDGRSGAHIVAGVGAVDVQGEVAVREATDPDGVVEIACRLAIDDHDRHVAEVAAPLDVGLGDPSGHRLRLLDDLGRELVGQVVLADDDLHVDAKIVGVAEDFDHAADRGRAALGILQHFDVDHHAVQFGDARHVGRGHPDAVERGGAGGREFHAVRDIDPLMNPAIGGHHVAAAPADFEFADHGGMGALQHLDDVAIGAAAGLDARDAHDHAVAMHGLFGGFGGNEDVAGDAWNRTFGD